MRCGGVGCEVCACGGGVGCEVCGGGVRCVGGGA